MSLQLNQTHDKQGTDPLTGWEIWKKTPGLGVLKGLSPRHKFLIVSQSGRVYPFNSLEEFEVYKAQMVQAGRQFTGN